jgi:hypothetical protein
MFVQLAKTDAYQAQARQMTHEVTESLSCYEQAIAVKDAIKRVRGCVQGVKEEWESQRGSGPSERTALCDAALQVGEAYKDLEAAWIDDYCKSN